MASIQLLRWDHRGPTTGPTASRDPAFVHARPLCLHQAEHSGDRCSLLVQADGRMVPLHLLGPAVHLANHGWAQEARDIAEHALNWANDDPGELRLAWTAFADVYHRLGDLHDSLVGMLLAASLQEARLTREGGTSAFMTRRLPWSPKLNPC